MHASQVIANLAFDYRTAKCVEHTLSTIVTHLLHRCTAESGVCLILAQIYANVACKLIGELHMPPRCT